jgi:serine/threonine protein kinase/Ca2+-binding EF-hand superfamily protein
VDKNQGMGCSNTKSEPASRQYSISFDSSDESNDLFGQGHPSHDADHLILSANKLELIIDQDHHVPTSPSSLHSPRSIRPSSPTSPLWNGQKENLTSPLYDRQKILLNQNHYVIESLLQEGAIGKVYVGRHKLTGQEHALKFFGYTNIDPEERDIEHEIQVMNSFQGIHGIVQMIGYFYDTPNGLIPGKIFCNPYPVIVMELLTGGEVFETIHHNSHITEFILSKIFYSMTLSIQSIHQKHYIHRDIKLENMMFTSPAATSVTFTPSASFASYDSSNKSTTGTSPTRPPQIVVPGSATASVASTTSGVSSAAPGEGRRRGGTTAATAIKIIDFGLMVKVTSPDAIYHDDDVVGTPGYLAPESLDYYDYSYASDIWSLGCCLYSMLSGLLPFNPNINQQDVHHRYRPMTGPAWVNISNEAKDLVKQLLQRSSHARYSIEQILSHPWLIDSAPDLLTTTVSPGGSTITTTTPAGVMTPVGPLGEGDTGITSPPGVPSHRHEHLGDEYLSRIKYLSLKQKMKSFFMNSNQILDNNQRTRDQLQRIIPLLRKESSSVLSRSSSGSSFSMTPSPLSKNYSFLSHHHQQLSSSTIASSTTHSPLKPTPPNLKGTQKYKSTPPGGPTGGGGPNSPYIQEKFSVLSKPPIPHPHHHTPPPLPLPPPTSLKSSHSLDFLGHVTTPSPPPNSTPTSPLKPLHLMSENELQSRLQLFKRSVLSSLLRSSTSTRSMSSNDIGGNTGGHDGAGTNNVNGPNRYTINKETFLCLMLDAGLPELASSRVFHIFDTDHNGVLDLKEFLLTMLAFQSRSPRRNRSHRSQNLQQIPQWNRRKFYRSKELGRSTLDQIQELKTDVPEVRTVRSRPVSTPSGSLVFQDIINASESEDQPQQQRQRSLSQGGPIGVEMTTLEEDIESDFAASTSNSSPEKILGNGGGPGAVDDEELLARLYFDIFDLDGNGSIDKDELRVAVNAFFLDEITTGTVGLTPTSSGGGGRGGGEGAGGEGVFSFISSTQSDADESTSSYSQNNSHSNSHNSSSHSLASDPLPPTHQLDHQSIQKALLSKTETETERKKQMNQSQSSLYSSPAEATRDIEELFETIDSNHTGKITFNEFLPFFKKIRRSGSDIDE